MKLTLGFSPCPNDTFIFDAMIHQKIDTEGLSFEVSFEDVESLNAKAFDSRLDITKLSYHAYAYAVQDYVLLDAGSALGFGVGPLLITNNAQLADKLIDKNLDLHDLKVGIPGKFTTANFLLGLAFPDLKNSEIFLFSDIENALLDGRIDLGLIIHENRFTYKQKGLSKVIDLGAYWEQLTQLPIPLGGIVVKRTLPDPIKEKLNRVLKRSVQYAFDNPKSSLSFIRSHAQAMEEEVMYKHIELYVNEFSLDLGELGRKAIGELFSRATELKIIPDTKGISLFLN